MSIENKLQWVNRKVEEVSSGTSQQVDTTSAATLSGIDVEMIKQNLGYKENNITIDAFNKGQILQCSQNIWDCNTRDFELFFDIEFPQYGGIFFNTNIGGICVRIQNNNIFDVIFLTTGGFSFTVANAFLVDERMCLNITRQGSIYNLYKNGILIATHDDTVVTDFGLWNGVYSLGYSFAPGLYGGVLEYYRHHSYSIVLTDQQRKDLVKGISPYFNSFTRESIKDATMNPFTGYASNTTELPVISGNDITTSMTSDNVLRIRPFVGKQGIVKAGTQIRIKFTTNIDLTTVNPLNTVGSYVWSDYYVNIFTPAGTYERVYVIKDPVISLTWDEVVFFFFASPTLPVTMVLTDLQVEILGCITKYESDSLLKSGRWLDKSGNFNDLVPNSQGFITQSDIESITRNIKVKKLSTTVAAGYSSPAYSEFIEIGDTQNYGGTSALKNILHGDSVCFASDGSDVAAGIFPVQQAYTDVGTNRVFQALLCKNGSDTVSGETYGHIVATLK